MHNECSATTSPLIVLMLGYILFDHQYIITEVKNDYIFSIASVLFQLVKNIIGGMITMRFINDFQATIALNS
jgi:hypothetical protein